MNRMKNQKQRNRIGETGQFEPGTKSQDNGPRTPNKAYAS